MTTVAIWRTYPLQAASEALLNLGLLLLECGKDRIIFLPMGMLNVEFDVGRLCFNMNLSH